MKIHDISQEVFTCTVYPGDSVPAMTEVCRISGGDSYNLTDFSMCAHNGTHIDAPFHFLEDGKTIERLPLEKMVGMCYVAAHDGTMTGEDATHILNKARENSPEADKRILLRGNTVITAEAAEVFAAAGIYLIGVESQSVGDASAPMAVHKILLAAEVVLLEGIRLNRIKEAPYFLGAAPLKLGGADGAPCRAFLIEK